ncbi:MAG: hypothetical protein ACTHOG_02600 [Marmoricola sp.]
MGPTTLPSGAAAVLGVALVVAGCSSTPTYNASTAQTLQSQVLAVAKSAQAGSYANGLKQLTALQRADDAALAKGDLTQAHHDAIAAAIALVRSDLSTLQAKAQARALQLRLAQAQRQREAAQRAAQQAAASAKTPKHHKGHGGDNGNGGD